LSVAVPIIGIDADDLRALAGKVSSLAAIAPD